MEVNFVTNCVTYWNKTYTVLCNWNTVTTWNVSRFKMCVFLCKNHNIRIHCGVDVKLQPFLTTPLDRWEWHDPWSGCLIRWKSCLILIYKPEKKKLLSRHRFRSVTDNLYARHWVWFIVSDKLILKIIYWEYFSDLQYEPCPTTIYFTHTTLQWSGTPKVVQLRHTWPWAM